jgi:hypothetical protein
VNEHAFGFPFTGTHHVDIPVAIQICEYRVFGRLDSAHGNGGPFLFRFVVSGMEVGTNDSSFFPTGGDVHEVVPVNVSQSDTIRSL